MYNNDYNRENEKEEESLIKDMAKKAISKKIQTVLPSKYIFIFIGVGAFFVLLFLITIISSISILFFFNDGSGSGGRTGSNLSYIGINSEDNYWWPIGGAEVEILDEEEYATGNPTAVTITSEYGSRTYIDEKGNERSDYHYGIDIGSSGGVDYVIAVVKGIVYAVGTGCPDNEGSDSKCNDGMGNYVTIKHYNGNYTRYAHLSPGSITVNVGDNVNQGQIIGKMGNSGSSTGKHLDFKIFIGDFTTAENPLNYISADNPRPVTVSSGSSTIIGEDSLLLAMLHSWEGTGPTDGDYYVVYDDGTGVLTVGHGVTLKWNKSRFEARNVDFSSLSKGSKIEKSIVDDIELELLEEKRNSVLELLSKNNIILKDYQVDALVSRMYNIGNVGGFPDKYNQYGNTQALYDNYMKDPVTAGGQVLSGLVRRRDAEWNLFHNGVYTFNS